MSETRALFNVSGQEWMPRLGRACACMVALSAGWFGGLGSLAAEPRHGIAMHGEPALPSDFQHLPYARPDAPKGGTLRLGELGSFDSLNPLILKGVAPAGLRDYVYESLLARSADEPFTLYGLLARSVEVPEDRTSVTFQLEAAARFSDGAALTAEDVLFSWRLLKDKGQPFHRTYYGLVIKAEAPDAQTVRFTFADGSNREAALLLGLMPILPRHRIDPATFDETTQAPPIGSGPYVVAGTEPGRSITFARNTGWWARDKAIAKGRYNVDRIRIDYFRDQTTLFEAFKAGEIDFRAEDDAGRWAEGYDFAAVKNGQIQKSELSTSWPAGMSALVFNTRRPVFADPRVRRALILMFDFEWINKSLFHDLYARTQSLFERSELSAFGKPADAAERSLLAPFPNKVRPEMLEGRSRLPVSGSTGRNRANMRDALALLKEAGFEQEDGRLVHRTTRKTLDIEMLSAKRGEERLFQAFAQSLALIGISAHIRTVDSAQRWARLKAFDFDMIQWTWGASLSPGNEQRNRWGSESAERPNALNFAGVKDAAVDAMIEALVAARERPGFVSAVRALDRVVMSGDYLIPLYHPKGLWVAWRSELKAPSRAPLSGLALETWWLERANP